MRRYRSIPTLTTSLILAAGLSHSARAEITPITFASFQTLPSIGRVAAIAELDGRPGAEIVGLDESSVLVLRNLGGRSFAPAQTVPTGGPVGSLQLVDFDRDGRLDLACVRATPPTVVVLRNLTNLAFDAAVEYPLPDDPRWMLAGDLDGDAWPDLLVACRDTLVALLTLPDGTLKSVATHLTSGFRTGLALGDLDGDATLDVAMFSESDPPSGIQWRHGNGDGTFGAAIEVPSILPNDQYLISDLDLDGGQDVITADWDGVHWHRNLGLGTFAPAVQLDSGDAPGYQQMQIAVSDLNKDRTPEVLAARGSYAGGQIQILRGPASPEPALEPAWRVPNLPTRLVVGDLDGDGLPEAVLGCESSFETWWGGPPSTSILWNDGRGFFTGKLSIPLDLPWPDGLPSWFGLLASRPSSGAVRDLVASLYGQIRLVRNAGNGTFFPADSVGFGLVLASADLDHDGDDDLVVAANDSAWVLPRLGSGGFGPAGPVYAGLRPLGIADFNGDGEADLALADAANAMWIRSGDGSGGFGPADGPGIVLTRASAVWLGDVDGDAFGDVAWAEGPAIPGGTYEYPTLQVAVRVARNDRQGRFVSWDLDSLEIEHGDQGYSYAPSHLRSGDVDGDGDLDLALMVGGRGSSSLGWWGAFLNVGDGTFTVAGPARFGGNPGGVLEIADMNGDGMDDALIHQSDGLDYDFHAVPAIGGGAFGPLEYLIGDDSVMGMVVEDFDADGRRDVALLGSYYRRISIMRNISEFPGDPTPALVSCLGAQIVDGAVEIAWYSPDGVGFRGAVERAASPSEAWQEVASLVADGRGYLQWRDSDVRSGARYGYRLLYMDGVNPRRTAEVWIDVPTPPTEVGLRVTGPNPARGLPVFELSMPGPGEISIEILDISGRRLETQRVRFSAAGVERVALTGAPLAPGLYFARARAHSGVAIARFAILR